MNAGQPFVGQGRDNAHTLQNRHSGDFRSRGPSGQTSPASGTASNGHPPVSVPVPHARNGHHDPLRANLVGARSPPNGKNTAHVPCKFFRQGACQAGKACPFLHGETITPCKYYQKGNCKFGMRCANEHITADGRRINKPAFVPQAQSGAALNLGGRVMPTQLPSPGHSLISMHHDHHVPGQPLPIPVPPTQSHDDYNSPWKQSGGYDIPIIDTTHPSYPGSAFGSPQNDAHLAMSPAARALNVMDVPLPASFESNGVSIIARTGPIAASVPARFGFESSPPSSYVPAESSTVRKLHSSAFGENGRNGHNVLGSSPSVSVSEDAISAPRLLHSQRFAKPRMISASLGTRGFFPQDEYDQDLNHHDDLDDGTFGEEFLPNNLQELLTPAERQRRLSRNADDDSVSNHRAALSSLGSPHDASPKMGSPMGTSPSRFNTFFMSRQQQQKSEAIVENTNPLGHVGSPLRPSILNAGSSPSLRASSRPVSGEFFVSSPPRQASASMLSQQLQRTRLTSRASESGTDTTTSKALQPPTVSRVPSGGSPGNPPNHLNRTASATSSVGVGRDKIDEEPELFAMDELGDSRRDSMLKRLSGSAGVLGGTSSSSSRGFGVIGGSRAPGPNGNA